MFIEILQPTKRFSLRLHIESGMGRDHSVDGGMAWDLLLAKRVWTWAPRCARVHESPEGVGREDITGKAGRQTFIIYSVNKHS